MKILKRGATASAQPASQAKLKPMSRSAPAAVAASETRPADTHVEAPAVVIQAKATLTQWLLSTVVGAFAGLVLGFVMFNILKVNW